MTHNDVLRRIRYIFDFDDNNKAAQNLAFSWTVKSFYEF